jgi:hypothetical protein
LQMLLEGKVGYVIGGLRQMMTIVDPGNWTIG